MVCASRSSKFYTALLNMTAKLVSGVIAGNALVIGISSGKQILARMSR